MNNGPKKKGNTRSRHVPASSRLSEAECQRLAQFLGHTTDARAEEAEEPEASPTDTPPGFFTLLKEGEYDKANALLESWRTNGSTTLDESEKSHAVVSVEEQPGLSGDLTQVSPDSLNSNKPDGSMAIVLVDDAKAFAASVEPDRRLQGIMPAPFVMRTRQRFPDYLPGLKPPVEPGLVSIPDMADLPTLEPERREIPALLTMFDAAGGEGLVHMRIFVEALLSVPADSRTALLQHVGPVTIGEIAGEWLQWSRKHYRVSGLKTGIALRRALAKIRDMAVPINVSGGFYYPLLLGAVEGWQWEDRLAFLAQLPSGARVGPPVDRNMLRLLGKKSAPAYRGYLSLCFEWDYYGGRKGRLILPSRPEVRRDEATGALIDDEGKIIVGKVVRDKRGNERIVGSVPAKAWNDPRALATGRREPNPAAFERYHRLYEADDLVQLCYPTGVYDNPSTRRKMRQPAKKAIGLIEAIGGCMIQRLGRKGNAWRIMPPDLVA